MKKLIFLFLLLAAGKSSFAQVNAQGWPADVGVFSIGAQETIMNNPAFDAWTLTNYNKKINNTFNGSADFAYYGKDYDGGLSYSGTNSFTFSFFGIYAGRRLTVLNSKISSWLNIGVGGLEIDRHDIAPVNYTLTPDEVGKKMKLQYTATYLELSSRNYLNGLHFRFGKHKQTSLNAGFYVTAGYDPFTGRAWKYGYDDTANTTTDDDGDSTTPFNSVTIHDIPLLNRFFMEVGVFVGIGN